MKKPYGISQELFDSMTPDQLRALSTARKHDAVRRERDSTEKLMKRNRMQTAL